MRNITEAKFGRHIFAVSAILLVLVSAFGISAYAGGENPQIYIEASETDENGMFELSVSMENTHFILYEIAVKYNSGCAVPVCEDGSEAEGFADFAEFESIDGVSYIGQSLEKDDAYFLFTGFVMPGAEGDNISDGMAYFGKKTQLCRFRFKKTADGDFGFDIASIYNGDAYSEFFPDGAVVMSALDGEERYVCGISIIDGESEKKAETACYYYSELYPKNFTKEQRLGGTVYLSDGDRAGAVSGALYAIDPNDGAVVPYKKDGVRYVPLRFVCESLGYGVSWDNGTVTVTKAGKSVSVDVYAGERAEIANSRTMIDEDLLCELIGVRKFSPDGNSVIIYDAIPEWIPERKAEKEALEAMKYVLSPLFRMFV